MVCTYTRQPSYPPGTAEPTAVTNVSGADLYWLPADTAKPCKVIATKISRAAASRLVSSINSSSLMKPGTYNCPSSTMAGIIIWFAHGAAGAQRVDVSLSGCRRVISPGRSTHTISDNLRLELSALAPANYAFPM